MKKILLLLLALAGIVSTASAWTTVKLLNSVEGKWDGEATTVMTKVGDGSGNFFYYILDSSTVTDGEGNYYFRIYVSDDEKYYGSYENDFAILDYTNYGGKESSYSFKLVTDKSSKYIISVGYWDDVWHFTATTYSGTGTITYVNNINSKNFTTPKAYVYCTGEARLAGGWPGTAMTLNADGTYTLSNVNIGKNTKVIISDNGTSQIGDQSMTGDVVIDGTGTASGKTVSINSYGVGTFCSQYPLDFSTATPSGLKAYRITASNKATGELTKAEVTKVPAGVGVYIEGTPSENYTVSPTATATSVGDNMLVGVTSDTQIFQIDEDNTNYILTVNKADGTTADSPKFFKVYDDGDENANETTDDGNTVPEGKAYLQIPTANAAREFFWFDGETTAINAVKQEHKFDGKVFNLAGQHIANPTKGLYIVNGKKVIK